VLCVPEENGPLETCSSIKCRGFGSKMKLNSLFGVEGEVISKQDTPGNPKLLKIPWVILILTHAGDCVVPV